MVILLLVSSLAMMQTHKDSGMFFFYSTGSVI